MRSFWIAMALTLSTAGAFADDAKPADAKPADGAKKEEAPKADATAKKDEAAAPGTVTCTSGGETRTLTITKGDGYACQLKYTKGGQDTFPAQAKNDATYCDGKLTMIKDKLVAAGYKCE